MPSAMDVDGGAGVEEAKGEVVPPPTGNGAAGNKGQKGEGDRNVMLHPVRLSQTESIESCSLWLYCMKVSLLCWVVKV